MKGCEVLGIGIPKDLLNSGSQKGHARIILKPLGKEQPTDQEKAAGHFGMGLPSPPIKSSHNYLVKEIVQTYLV